MLQWSVPLPEVGNPSEANHDGYRFGTSETLKSGPIRGTIKCWVRHSNRRTQFWPVLPVLRQFEGSFLPWSLRKEVFVLFYLALAACALLSVVLALALVREVRLRRALEALLHRILSTWRRFHGSNPTRPGRNADRRDDPDDRL
jgi:hypothetical protein